MTREEEIIHMLRKLETLSRRNPKDMPPMHRHPGKPGHAEGARPFPERPCPQQEAGHHGRGRILAALIECGSMSQTQLAAHLDIRPQSLSELLGKVEAEGLVSRKQSEEDKRQTIVSLTEEGKARVAGFRDAHRRRAEEFLSPLSEEEKEALAAILNKLVCAAAPDDPAAPADPEAK